MTIKYIDNSIEFTILFYFSKFQRNFNVNINQNIINYLSI